MKAEDLLLIGGAAFLFLSSQNYTNGGSGLVDSQQQPVPLSPSKITPSPSGPTSTSVGVIPSSQGFPFNLKVDNITAVGDKGEIYGTYSTKAVTSTGQVVDVGNTGKIPQVTTTAQAAAQQSYTGSSSSTSTAPKATQPTTTTWVSKDTSSPNYGKVVYQNQATGKITAVSTTPQPSAAVKTLATNLISSVSKSIFK